ncbi:MAG: hypothetical protein KAU95_03280 [Candidatus Aenigmarchaeota archaeon]|nr:hypothetical protein [Candidatus Aenigmarchaeota archaeon]
MKRKELKIPVSEYEQFCEGASLSGPNKDYVGVVGVTCAQVPKKCTPKLDEIVAYDYMEKILRIGQVNMIIVSSFCRARNGIWGLDIAEADTLKELFKVDSTTVYNGKPLHTAGRALFHRYPIAPGSPVFFATKDCYGEAGEHIYATLGIGIPPEEDKRNARLFMEDAGKLDIENSESSLEEKIEKMAQSIFEIGKNQDVEYEKIIILSDDLKISEGYIGGAMPAIAYVSLAGKALIPDMEKASLKEWINLQDKKYYVDPRFGDEEPIIYWKPKWYQENEVY